MIRTIIEITEDSPWQHDRSLQAVLDKLGFQPKDSPAAVMFYRDLYDGLADRGISPNDLVEEQRKKREARGA